MNNISSKSTKRIKRNVKLSLQVLELVAAGSVLAFVKDKKERKKIYDDCDEIWHEMDRKQLYQIINRFGLQGIIKKEKMRNDTYKVSITGKGKRKILKNRFSSIELPKKDKWDGVWRIAIFDVPEKHRGLRDSFRGKLKSLGFVEFQKSIFVFPYECEKEIKFVINYLGIEEYVYYLESSIYPDKELRKHFYL